jgi:integrase
MKKQCIGPMGQLIKRYLILKRSFGLSSKNAGYLLDGFNRYLAICFPKINRITREMVVGYLSTTNHISSATRQQYLTHLRQFCRFLFQLNPNNYIPEKNLFPPERKKYRFHIYSVEELKNILRLTCQLGPPQSLRPYTSTTIFSLLWVSGMRISEVLNLNLGDVDLETGVIHIRQTKFYKSRFIPLSLSTAEALRRYRNKRARYGHSCHVTAPLFVNQRGKRCGSRGIQHVFCDIIEQLEIKTTQGRRPRIHDFRHSFATRWLNEFSKSGKDPTAYLPILATYLGHTKIDYTQVYLHPSLELLQTAGQQFNDHIHKLQTERNPL